MSVISKSVAIKAPVGKVFSFVTSPENWTKFVTSLVEVKNLSEDAPAKGSTFKWGYKMMGLKFTGDGTITEYAKNKRFAISMTSKVNIDEHYEFEGKEDGMTELHVKIEYEMPNEMLRFIADSRLVERLNNLEAKNVLDKIKMMCETGA